jgi:DedD protein
LDYTEAVTSPVKERLTGALILIVVVVIVVPELFSGRAEPRPSTDAPDAQSADEGPPLRSYTLELGGGQAQPETQIEPVPAPEPVAETSPVDQAPPQASKPEVPAAQPAVVEPAPITRGWWVQLGSFSARANADRLGGTLTSAGYSVVVSPTLSNGKELFRVRAGPVADREAAVALQSRLSAAGHKGSLVAPR